MNVRFIYRTYRVGEKSLQKDCELILGKMEMLDCSMEEDYASKYSFPVKKLSGAFAASEEEDLLNEEEEEFVESKFPPVEELEESVSPIKEKEKEVE